MTIKDDKMKEEKFRNRTWSKIYKYREGNYHYSKRNSSYKLFMPI